MLTLSTKSYVTPVVSLFTQWRFTACTTLETAEDLQRAGLFCLLVDVAASIELATLSKTLMLFSELWVFAK